MGKILRHLKPFIFSIIGIILFLLLQANCDLALPDYMARIVNVGIQQGGIENAVPDAIRKTEMDKLALFMSEADKEAVLENYVLKEKLPQEEIDKLDKTYSQAKDHEIYKLNTKDKEAIAKLNSIMSKPILIIYFIEKSADGAFEGMGFQTSEFSKMFSGIPEGADPFAILMRLPEEQLESMKDAIVKEFDKIPESFITQGAISYIKDEYNALGRDTENLQTNYILYSGLLMLLIALTGMAATVVVGLLAARISAGVGRSLRKNVFENVVGFSNTEFDKFSTSSLITRCTNDIQQVQMLIIMVLRITFYAPILGIGGVIKVLNTDTSMSWIIGVSVLVIMILVMVLFTVAMPKFKSMQKLVDRLNLVTREALTGMMVVRAFGTQKKEEEKFDRANTDFTGTNLFVSRVMALMMPVMMLVMNGIMLLIIWVGAHRIDLGEMQVGNMMAFIQYTMQIIMAFLMISMVSIILPRASVSVSRISEVINTGASIKDPENQKEFNKDLKGTVEFKNVCFKYPGAEEYVLYDISFTAKPSQTTAFIGSTGSGKSTLINLIPRFYDVTEGQILVDGVDIRDVSQHELRERLGYVPQKAVLFSGTIESNLKYGRESAVEEDLKSAAEIAQVMDFISEKQEGFQAEISQGGANVSGGQKQRLSIARALVKKPEIYIFDDSFSALDFKTDAALRKALKVKTEGATVLIVAQRISTVMTADQILVLDNGRVAGIGTHKELMKSCEVYRQIAFSQLSKEELLA